jgi:hypothetical protein
VVSIASPLDEQAFGTKLAESENNKKKSTKTPARKDLHVT